MPAVTKIKQIEDGYIVFTSAILKAHEEQIIKSELKTISAKPLGHIFFRVA